MDLLTEKEVKDYAKLVFSLSKTKIKKGNYVMISTPPLGKQLALELYRLCLKKGAEV